MALQDLLQKDLAHNRKWLRVYTFVCKFWFISSSTILCQLQNYCTFSPHLWRASCNIQTSGVKVIWVKVSYEHKHRWALANYPFFPQACADLTLIPHIRVPYHERCLVPTLRNLLQKVLYRSQEWFDIGVITAKGNR